MKLRLEENYMKKGMVAVTMTVATGLGLGCPLVAMSQTPDHVQQNETAPAPAPEAVAPQPSEAAPPPPASEAQDGAQQNAEPPAAAPQEAPATDQPQSAGAPAAATDQAPATAEPPSEAAPPAAAAPEAPAPGNEQQNNAGAVPLAPPEAAGPAAGEAPAPAAPEVGGLETVVVTARRTAENLQKVPVAITAFSDKDLQREQINTGQDLAGRVPSLVINSNSQGRNTETPTIRGQGATFGASPGVIIYYAEVPLPADSISNGQGGPGKFFDLANLQVLKGSQGTLFGRNTTGGALLLEPHKPDDRFEASVRGELSNFNGKGVEGIYNTPITDELSLRVGAKWYEREGFTKDVATGVDYDNKGYRTFRLGLMWKPTDGIQNYLLGYYTHSADNGTSQIIEQINSNTVSIGPPDNPISLKLGCLTLLAASKGQTLGNCGQQLIAEQQARGIRSVELSAQPDDILDTQALIDSFSYQLNDELTLRNIASYSLYKHTYRWDTDGSQYALDDITSPPNTDSSDTATYTEEAQVQGNLLDARLKLVTGLYYEYLQPNGTQQNAAVSFGLADTQQQFSISRRSYGPYVQGTLDLGALADVLDGLNFTAGARYSVDDQSGWAETGTTATVLGMTETVAPPHPHDDRVKTEAPTYTFSVDYKVPTTLLYAKVSHGYKAGGFSPIAVNPANYIFKPEFVMNYETGHKSDFTIGEMPARVNSAIYLTDYTDMQRTSGDSYQGAFGGATYTAGKAKIMGFETDMTIQPFQSLTVTANYSYTYAKYEDFNLTYNSQYNLHIPDCTGAIMSNGDTMNLNCVPFQYTPKHQTSATVRYQLPVDESLGRMEQTVTYSFTDKQYTSATSIPSEEPGAWLGAYGILNASFNWTGIYGSAFDLQLFGANLTDREYRITNSNVWNVFFFQSSIYGEPRTFGAQVGYHWGD
jgi:iron complex outermembrane receptor protein